MKNNDDDDDNDDNDGPSVKRRRTRRKAKPKGKGKKAVRYFDDEPEYQSASNSDSEDSGPTFEENDEKGTRVWYLSISFPILLLFLYFYFCWFFTNSYRFSSILY